MSYKSDKQRRFFHTDTAKEAGITPKEVKEFDTASKGMDLPEKAKKMADGGYAEELEPGIYGNTDPGHIKSIVDNLGSGMATGSALELPAALKGLGEAGEVTLGKLAPKMDEPEEVSAFVKGIQKGYKGSPDIKIYGVKGPADKLKTLFGDEAPGSVPEHILRQKGLLPDTSVNINKPAPNAYADGGEVTDDGDWKDKLKTVMATIFNSPAAKIAGAATDPMGTALRAGADAAPSIINAEVPAIQKIASPMSGGVIPPPAQPAAPVPPTPPVVPANAPLAPIAGNAGNSQPVLAEKPAATDLLAKLTDNDGAKMSALLASLKDQDKRAAFAQALGVIGDTFGNIGRAKAGMPGEGFKTPQMIAGMHEASKKSQIENLTQSLASDPNSQTSKMAQQTLMQAMGIKIGDPRAAAIMKMPALSISQMMPQMSEAVKTNLEKEKNLIESKKADVQASLEKEKIGVEATNAKRQEEMANTAAATDILKNTSGIRDIIPGTGVRDIARQTLERNMGSTPQPRALTATNTVGHKIQSTDGGHTWRPL